MIAHRARTAVGVWVAVATFLLSVVALRVPAAPSAQAPAPAAPAAPTAPARPLLASPQGANAGADYLAGVEAMERADWKTAIEALDRAVAKDSENTRAYVARGAALVLSEQPAAAQKDLERALRLSPQDNEARLWMASAIAMQGDFDNDSTYFPDATNDPYETLVRRTTKEYGDLAWQQAKQDALAYPKAREKREKARQQFPELGRQFAARNLSQPSSAGDLATLARQRYDQGRFADALVAYARVLASQPDDPTALYYHAGSLLGVGDPVDARPEYTRTLTQRNTFAFAYMGRALSAARMGDARRARADLDILTKLDPENGKKLAPQIEQILTGIPTSKEPNAALLEAVRKNPADAMTLVLVMNGRRLRWDESYQDQLRVLEAAVAAHPRDAGALAALGDFLNQNLNVMSDRPELRGPMRPFRVTSPAIRQSELNRAQQLLDEALSLDPNCVPALAARASVAIRCGQWADAEQLLRRAMAREPDNPRVLEGFAEVLDNAAAVRQFKATNLRETKTWSTYEWFYTRYPSQQELEAADEYERQADALFDTARAHLEEAATKETTDGLYCRALLAERDGDTKALRDILLASLRLKPDDRRAREMLKSACLALGDQSAALEEQSTIANLMETTAAPLLAVVWDCVRTTRWETGRRVLLRASEIDPADPRVAAYLGVVDAGDGKTDDAVAWFNTALAIRDARGKLAGVKPTGPLRPCHYGLDMAVRIRMGRVLSRAGRHEEAGKVFAENMALEPRILQGDTSTEVFESMLPETSPELNVYDETDTVWILMAWSRVGVGSEMVALKKYAEAIPVLLPVTGGSADRMASGMGSTHVGRPQIYAALALTKAYMGLNNLRAAKRWAELVPQTRHGSGPSLGANPTVEPEGTRLSEEIARRIDQALHRVADAAGVSLVEDRRNYNGDAQTIRQAVEDVMRNEPEEIWRKKIRDMLAEFASGHAGWRTAWNAPKSATKWDRASEEIKKLAVDCGYPAEGFAKDGQSAGEQQEVTRKIAAEAGIDFNPKDPRSKKDHQELYELIGTAVRQICERAAVSDDKWRAAVVQGLKGVMNAREIYLARNQQDMVDKPLKALPGLMKLAIEKGFPADALNRALGLPPGGVRPAEGVAKDAGADEQQAITRKIAAEAGIVVSQKRDRSTMDQAKLYERIGNAVRLICVRAGVPDGQWRASVIQGLSGVKAFLDAYGARNQPDMKDKAGKALDGLKKLAISKGYPADELDQNLGQ